MTTSNPHAAMILCAGLGTRLRPLTELVAKPMVPVGDAPAVAHVFARVAHLLPVVVNVHHHPEGLERWAEASGVKVSREPELLGTAGGLAAAGDLLGDGDVVVWNGDVLSNLDVRDLTEAHDRGGALATLAVRPRTDDRGNVGLDDQGRVVRLRGERFGAEASSADFLGIHVVGAELRATLPRTGCLVGDVYIPALARGARLGARLSRPSFRDIGSLAEYLAANRAWLADRGLEAWAGEGASIDASIEGSVVGARARVDAPTIRSVVWPGAHVREPVEDAIVTLRGVVRP